MEREKAGAGWEAEAAAAPGPVEGGAEGGWRSVGAAATGWAAARDWGWAAAGWAAVRDWG